MTSRVTEIQTLIADIDDLLANKGKRLNKILSQGQEARQTLEKLRGFLANLESEVALGNSEVEQQSSPLLARFISQGSQNANGEGDRVIPQVQAEIQTLLKEKEKLGHEVRELEQKRLQNYSLAQQVANQEQMISEFLQVLSSRVRDGLPPQMSSSNESVVSQSSLTSKPVKEGENVVDAKEVLPANLTDNQTDVSNSLDRLQHLNRLTSDLDRRLLALDGTVNTVFEALERNVNTYNESLSAAIARMHSQGIQSDELLNNFIHGLRQRLSGLGDLDSQSEQQPQSEPQSPQTKLKPSAADLEPVEPVSIANSFGDSISEFGDRDPLTTVADNYQAKNPEVLQELVSTPELDTVTLDLNPMSGENTSNLDSRLENKSSNSDDGRDGFGESQNSLASGDDNHDAVEELYASLFDIEQTNTNLAKNPENQVVEELLNELDKNSLSDRTQELDTREDQELEQLDITDQVEVAPLADINDIYDINDAINESNNTALENQQVQINQVEANNLPDPWVAVDETPINTDVNNISTQSNISQETDEDASDWNTFSFDEDSQTEDSQTSVPKDTVSERYDIFASETFEFGTYSEPELTPEALPEAIPETITEVTPESTDTITLLTDLLDPPITSVTPTTSSINSVSEISEEVTSEKVTLEEISTPQEEYVKASASENLLDENQQTEAVVRKVTLNRVQEHQLDLDLANFQDNYQADSEVQESETRESEVQQLETQESEVQESEIQQLETQESEIQQLETRESEIQESLPNLEIVDNRAEIITEEKTEEEEISKQGVANTQLDLSPVKDLITEDENKNTPNPEATDTKPVNSEVIGTTITSVNPLDSVWYLGIDLGTTGICAVLFNRSNQKVYPLYWQTTDESQAPQLSSSFRLPTEVYLPTAAIAQKETENQELSSSISPVTVAEEEKTEQKANTSKTAPSLNNNLFSAKLKPYLNIALPYRSISTYVDGVAKHKWEPLLQMNELSIVPLVWVVRSLSKLLLTLKSDNQSTTMSLTAAADGLNTADFEQIIDNLAGVICNCPSNWTEQYRFNIREALLTSKLVQHPQQVFFIEEAIASLLPELDGATGEQVSFGGQIGVNYIQTRDREFNGSTLVVNIGASATEMALVDIPEHLHELTHDDFMLHNFSYGGQSIEQDIVCQLLIPEKWRSPIAATVTPSLRSKSPVENPAANSKPWNWRSSGSNLEQMRLSSLGLDKVTLPKAGEPDTATRILLQKRLESSVLGQALLDAAGALKLILQQQESFTIELADQRWTLQRRDLEAQVFVPFVRRLNREINRLLVAKGIPTEAINQAILTGGVSALGAVNRWLRQKLPNAKIIQDIHQNQPNIPQCTRVAYGLALLPLHPQVLEIPRQQYTDYFLFTELLRLLPSRAVSFGEIIQLFEERGINTRSCQQRLLAFLEGKLPSGLIPNNVDSNWITRSSLENKEYKTIPNAPMFEKQGSVSYRPNAEQLQYLRSYLDAIKSSTGQSLEEPYTVNFAISTVK
ncbi:MAG: hypothetical protein AAF378_12400 [Cyanobacteria bacterium P01_A01_bin.84]